MTTSNNIDEVGAFHLAETLRFNESLLDLHISYNQIGDKGVQYFSKALLQNTSLQCLNVRKNHFGNKGAKCLAQLLLKNTSLQYLDIGENYMLEEGEGELAIREALKKNPSLKDIDGLYLKTRLWGYVVEENEFVLERWRLELHERRTKLQAILSKFIAEIHITRSILQMESAFPFPLFKK